LGANEVLFQGDENITSAALAPNGSLLVLSTMTTVRMFSLSWNESEDEDEDDVLNIDDLPLPPQIADDGARVISLSADNQWLSIIRPSNEVYLAKLTTTDTPEIHPKLLRLERSSGKARTLRGVTMGTLGDYDRTIRTVTFSADSKLLATGDLAGFVDFWALEDVSPESEPQTKTNGTSNDDSDDDSDSDDDDSDDITLDNQRWKALPAMPCQHAGIVFISFRPAPATSSGTDDRLLVLTSRHQLTEYEALRGKFSDWSQKNPKSHLPEDFIGLKDRAIGGVCGLFGQAQMPKLLLYGPSWMWMFDLTLDYPAPTNNNDQNSQNNTTGGAQKRKRLAEEDEHERRKYNSGAGDLIPTSQARVTLGTKVRKIDTKQEKEAIINAEKHRQHGNKSVKTDDEYDDDDEEEDDDDEDNTNPFFLNGEPDFAHLRREDKEEDSKTAEENKSPIFWHSYRFRDILGVLPIGSGHDAVEGNKKKDTVVELAIVERPLWDMELGERYVKDYE
jgi:U3 small nucleolar RNA-associated protein 4